MLASAALLKDKQRRGTPHPLLPGKTLGLLFQKPSTRTRVSFEAGMNQLGGHALVLPMGDIQLSRGESVADTARVLSRYLDAIVIRTYDHAIVEEWAREATMPVINGLTDLSHPCQALSDLMTIQEKKGRLKGLKPRLYRRWKQRGELAHRGSGEDGHAHRARVSGRVSAGAACRRSGESGGRENRCGDRDRTDPHVAVKEADVVYTDVWISMGREREQARRLESLGSLSTEQPAAASRETRCDRHALFACPSRRRNQRRGAGWPAVGHHRSSGKSPAHAEGHLDATIQAKRSRIGDDEVVSSRKWCWPIQADWIPPSS